MTTSGQLICTYFGSMKDTECQVTQLSGTLQFNKRHFRPTDNCQECVSKAETNQDQGFIHAISYSRYILYILDLCSRFLPHLAAVMTTRPLWNEKHKTTVHLSVLYKCGFGLLLSASWRRSSGPSCRTSHVANSEARVLTWVDVRKWAGPAVCSPHVVTCFRSRGLQSLRRSVCANPITTPDPALTSCSLWFLALQINRKWLKLLFVFWGVYLETILFLLESDNFQNLFFIFACWKCDVIPLVAVAWIDLTKKRI